MSKCRECEKAITINMDNISKRKVVVSAARFPYEDRWISLFFCSSECLESCIGNGGKIMALSGWTYETN